jgi:hypothetical protein
MLRASSIDGVLIQWGDRLFYPGNRIVRNQPQVRRRGQTEAQRAADIRRRIRAVLVRRAPQVMVKVTGGGRGMKAIAAHFRYISKNGRLAMQNERGELVSGQDAVRDVAEEWRYGGSFLDDYSPRREAYNIMLSMPRGTDPKVVRRAAQDFAHRELAGHKYVLVLHDHQANPHVHMSVRAESSDGRRLNPRKGDLQRWREVFAQRLREYGVDAEATRWGVRRAKRRDQPLWKLKAAEDGRLRQGKRPAKQATWNSSLQPNAVEAWKAIRRVLKLSVDQDDRELGDRIAQWILDSSPASPSELLRQGERSAGVQKADVRR